MSDLKVYAHRVIFHVNHLSRSAWDETRPGGDFEGETTRAEVLSWYHDKIECITGEVDMGDYLNLIDEERGNCLKMDPFQTGPCSRYIGDAIKALSFIKKELKKHQEEFKVVSENPNKGDFVNWAIHLDIPDSGEPGKPIWLPLPPRSGSRL